MLNLYPGQTLGGHQLIRRLGGNDGRQVFSALNAIDGGQSVVKVAALDATSGADRLAREFSVLRAAAGSSVVAALGHSVSLDQQLAWLILAAYGPSLASILAAVPEQRLPVNTALAAAHAAATAVGDLHAREWGHGDLKPGNLLCNPDGTVLLSDLEFAWELSARETDGAAEATFAGTPAFMAPELWKDGSAARVAASDVWAIGVTLYFCLHSAYPFGQDVPDVLTAIKRGLPERLAEMSPQLRSLFAALFAGDPRKRPQDGHAAAKVIASTMRQLGIDTAAARAAFGALVDRVPPGNAAEQGTWTPSAFGRAPGAATSEPPSVMTPQSAPAAPAPREFLDIASHAAIPLPPKAAAPEPSTVVGMCLPTVSSAAPPLVQRAAARWYRRMNPDQNFPLSVVLSGKEIRIAGGSGLGITIGQQQILVDPDDPVLGVEPMFPGCLVSPPRIDARVSAEDTECKFWITPLARGDLSDACVLIRYRGKIVETLPTPATVVTRTLAKILAVAGFVMPVATRVLSVAGVNPETRLRETLPALAGTIARWGSLRIGLGLCALLLTAAVLHTYVTRPLLSEPTRL